MTLREIQTFVRARLNADAFDSIHFGWRGSPPTEETPLGKRRLGTPEPRNIKNGRSR